MNSQRSDEERLGGEKRLEEAVHNATLMSLAFFLNGVLAGWGITRVVQGRTAALLIVVLGVVGYVYAARRYYVTRGRLR